METKNAQTKRPRRTPDAFKNVLAESAPAETTSNPDLDGIIDVPPLLDTKRGDMRPTMREENSMTRAARRAAELRDHLGTVEEGVDEFYFSKDAVPEGWSYEWKRRTVLGQEDPAYQVALAKQGWEAVPVARHPEMMPHGYKGPFIERKGMILMERPLEITEQIKEHELKKARLQVRQKEAQLNSSDQGQFGRTKSDGTSLVKINKSYEPIPIPK